MQKDVITMFANYNKSVNEVMNGFIKTLSADEWEKPLGGYFTSIHSLCSHIYICDFNWLKRFNNLRSFKTLGDPFFGGSYSFTETIFGDIGEYLIKRPDLDSRIISFIEELTSDDLGTVLKYTDSHGRHLEKKSGVCVFQFLNHEIHHRGMISVYLEMLGKENDFCSFVQYL